MNEDEVAALVGLDETEAERQVQERGWFYRVVARDGESYLITADLRQDRVNVSVMNGKVASADVG